MEYTYAKENISQHVVRYGLDLRPTLAPAQHRGALQDYCNWLIETFGGLFETLLSGPSQLSVQKSFPLAGGKKAQFPTFVLSPRGPIFAFPRRLFVDAVQDIDVGDTDAVFRDALAELKSRFLEQKVTRLGVVHELVFDTGGVDSAALVAARLADSAWRAKVANLSLQLEMPTEDKNVNVQIRPTFVRQPAGPQGGGGATRFGVIVNVDINNRRPSNDLPSDQAEDILVFACNYIAAELLDFLNASD